MYWNHKKVGREKVFIHPALLKITFVSCATILYMDSQPGFTMTKRLFGVTCFLFVFVVQSLLLAQPRVESQFRIARLKYSGGGDWYNDPSAEPNLLKFVKDNTTIDVDPVYEFVDLSSEKLFSYPFLFMTGHGNISFSDEEMNRLRHFLETGGFLYADDDYGMDPAFRREMERLLRQPSA